jgi:hypothetical protein
VVVTVSQRYAHEFGSTTMRLFPNEPIELRAFVDHSFVEIYMNQGCAVFSGFSVSRAVRQILGLLLSLQRGVPSHRKASSRTHWRGPGETALAFSCCINIEGEG